MPVVMADASDEYMTSVVWSICATGKKQLEAADFFCGHQRAKTVVLVKNFVEI